MRARKTVAALLALGVLAGGCGGSGGNGADPTPSPRPEPTGPTDPTPDGDSATETLLLSRQVQLQQGGDGLGPECRLREDTPVGFRRDPGVWLNNLYSRSEYPHLTVLCLRGFDRSQPIELVVSAAQVRARTTIEPVTGAPTAETPLGYDEEPPTTLFEEGGELRVYDRYGEGSPIEGPRGVLVTEMWQFMPPPEAREDLAVAGAFLITAEQAGRTASTRVPMPVPRTRDHYELGPPGDRQLAVIGYPAGARLPIGLYRKQDANSASATLVRQVATITIPASRVATVPIQQDLLRGLPAGAYCVLPPVAEEGSGCSAMDNWPDYPGEVEPGDTGPAVRRWQSILIAAGVMSDIPENRDGVYGPATEAKVAKHLVQREWSNPDGRATLGPGMYTLLTGVSAER